MRSSGPLFLESKDGPGGVPHASVGCIQFPASHVASKFKSQYLAWAAIA